MSDESKMIKKLQEHLNTKLLIKEIGKRKGIDIIETEGNDPRGDFQYPKEKESELIEAIDEYLIDYKYIKEDGDIDE